MAARRISDKDLRTFRDRMKMALRKAGKTARDVEDDLGLSGGTLTRIYGGRKKVDFDLVRGLAESVGVEPTSLLTKAAQRVLADEIAAWEAERSEAPADDAGLERLHHPGAAGETEPVAEPEPPPEPEPSPEPPAPEPEPPAPAPEPAPEPEATPEQEAAPEPRTEPAAASAPGTTQASAGAGWAPPPPPPPRKRKRDLPMRIVRRIWSMVSGLVTG